MDAVFDISKVDEFHDALVRMSKIDTQKTMKKMWNASMKDVTNNLQAKVRQLFPHGQYKNSGILRGKRYGALADDISNKVFSKGGGGVVYIFRNNQGRQCVLRWLDAGAGNNGERITEKAARRGKIAPINFFEPTVMASADTIIQQHIGEAEKEIINEIMKIK